MAASKIAVYSLPDLKNTTDDALPTYLLSLSSPSPSSSSSSAPKTKAFTQSHTHTDIRLALSLTAVLLSGLTFYLDYHHGFAATRTFTLYAVIVYFTLNAFLTYWIWGVESGCIFAGTSNVSGEQVRILSLAPNGGALGKYEPVYVLKVETTAKTGEKAVKEVRGEFRRWFDDEGRFVAAPFQKWLATEVGAVGRADPGRVEGKKGR